MSGPKKDCFEEKEGEKSIVLSSGNTGEKGWSWKGIGDT